MVDTGTITEAAILSVASSYCVDRLVFGTDATYGDAAATIRLLRSSPVIGDGADALFARTAGLLANE